MDTTQPEEAAAGTAPVADETPPSGPTTLGEAVNRLVHALQHDAIPPGDQAALRRLDPDEPHHPAFWKVAVRYLEDGLLPDPGSPFRDAQERRWAVVLSILARMKDYRGNRRLGRTLAEAGIAEGRVQRLLRAHDDALFHAVRGIVHQLASGGHHTDLRDLARLVIEDGAPWQHEVRRQIALDFYRNHRASEA